MARLHRQDGMESMIITDQDTLGLIAEAFDWINRLDEEGDDWWLDVQASEQRIMPKEEALEIMRKEEVDFIKLYMIGYRDGGPGISDFEICAAADRGSELLEMY